jgi:heme-degrading monooxygenase HmoA
VIARIWRGRTPTGKADAYHEYLRVTGLKEYAETPGNLGVFALRRVEGDVAEFLLLTLWESMDAVRTFAGEDPERAVYYAEDDEYLLEREPTVSHYEVLEAPSRPGTRC